MKEFQRFGIPREARTKARMPLGAPIHRGQIHRRLPRPASHGVLPQRTPRPNGVEQPGRNATAEEFFRQAPPKLEFLRIRERWGTARVPKTLSGAPWSGTIDRPLTQRSRPDRRAISTQGRESRATRAHRATRARPGTDNRPAGPAGATRPTASGRSPPAGSGR